MKSIKLKLNCEFPQFSLLQAFIKQAIVVYDLEESNFVEENDSFPIFNWGSCPLQSFRIGDDQKVIKFDLFYKLRNCGVIRRKRRFFRNDL